MRVLFTSLRNTSHFLPLTPFIQACRGRGIEVAVAAPKDLEEHVVPTGATFLPFGHPGDEGLRPIWQKLRSLPPGQTSHTVIREIFAGACASHALPGLMQTIEKFGPTLLVRESQEYAGLLAAERAGIPHARVAITARALEREMFAAAAPSLDAHRSALGSSLDPAGERLGREPVLTLFPESLDTSGSGTAAVLRFRARRTDPPPITDYWPGRTGPFVYLTLGTVMGNMDVSRFLYRVVLDGVRDLPIRVLLTTGSDLQPEVLGEVPANVHVERFVPQDHVIPHAAAVVAHGGSGTMLGTLAAGVPMVVVPMFADQPQNAARVQAVGAGLALPQQVATADDVRGALSRVLGEPSFRDAARKIAAEIAALPYADDAAPELERLSRTAGG